MPPVGPGTFLWAPVSVRRRPTVVDDIGPIQVGDDRIDGVGEDPGSENFGFPVLSFDLAYTIAETGTQLYTRFDPSPHIFLDL